MGHGHFIRSHHFPQDERALHKIGIMPLFSISDMNSMNTLHNVR
jgi:hypothetical protein